MADEDGSHGYLSRRGFVRVAAAAAAGLLLPACSEERRALGFRPEPRGHTPYITPNDDFYLVAVDPDYRPPLTPKDVEEKWTLSLTGLDGAAVGLRYGELYDNARHRIPYTFECIGNRVGGQLIGNAEWHVIPLSRLLAMAPGGAADAHAVLFEGLDHFYSSVSIERAMDDYAFVALRMNGEALPAGHGFPARVILPDLYGMKQPRWLRRIHLLRNPATTSYWEKRGWAGEVPVKTMSRLDTPPAVRAGRSAELTGIAFAGRRGIDRVEVSLDGGVHWQPCELVTGKEPHVWSLWRYSWPAPIAGRHRVMVRATDGSGTLQTDNRHPPSPDGASGYHTLSLTVHG